MTTSRTENTPCSLTESSGLKKLTLADIEAVAQGACFLGSGGGGSLQLSLQKMIPAFFNERTAIALAPLDLLTSDGDWGAVVAAMGSPLTLFEDPQLVQSAIPAFNNLADLSYASKAAGQQRFQSLQVVDFCLPVEVGAVNSIVPMIVATGSHGSPIVVVDADGAGRAVPTLPLTTYARQIELYPNVFGGNNKTEKGDHYDYASLGVQDESTLETACLALICSKAFGLASGLAYYSASGPTFRACAPVPNGISDSLQLGHIINSSSSGPERVSSVIEYIHNEMRRAARQVFYGQIACMQQATAGLDSGYVEIAGMDDFAGERLKLYIENENIWAERTTKAGTQPWIVGPDSMNYLTDTGDVFDNSDLWKRYGSNERPTVSIIGIQAAVQVRNNTDLLKAWIAEVHSKKGPVDYISSWLDV